MTVHSILTHTLTKLINLCIYLKLSALPMEFLVFFHQRPVYNLYYKCHPSWQLKNFSPAISVSNVLPLCFLEYTQSASETLQGEQGSLQGQQLLPSLQISSQGWKRQHSRNLKSLLLPYPMSNILLLEAEKPPGLHSSSWIFKRTSVAVQSESKVWLPG